ncbi:ABC transporter ATP-binding protein [Phytomonospora endophytica]|uniref:Branched-chain amino acid transport system ATP-binding protein n=1 Tax=Phytomonospora endophytica TaxID=714109 RepID=A0A841FIY6_9ACTN|nr:ATP-binding cassette domain-containing protein [Phytomonospora endophytica]MBB6037291.1 branched-chain amino acid transport system ATP-binding protein [Phytomonospora endophytica]GIG69965.1 ABC transporter ATP-binding protein [Phytomonospora endophytica]
MLELRGTGRAYGALKAVDDVDLTVHAGARHALIGPNGAGKSTLLHLAAGNLRPTAGRVLLAGRDVTRHGPARRARLGVGRTFQTPALIGSADCLTNVALAAWPAQTFRARWLRRDHAPHLARLDALGLADDAATPAAALSHGRRRLLELAVALAASPRLLLLDEPAAGLTDDDVGLLLTALGTIGAEVAVLLVEHHQELVRAFAGTVTVLHQGAVVTTGTPAEVAADPRVREIYQGALGAA